MNGAQALVQTLLQSGVNTCFTNPGTSEMHFVAALDETPMRAVLTLFEGVATGAADGYARMTGKPAATLLHLGCGLSNGLANLHNARRAKVPMVNIVGDHASYHVQYDAQLQSDIETVARNVSTWIKTSASTQQLGQDALEAVRNALGPPGEISTLILPADVSWGPGGQPATPEEGFMGPQSRAVDSAVIDQIAHVLSSTQKSAMILGGQALLEPGLLRAARLAEKTGVKLLAETFPARMQRGAGLPYVERLAYLAEMANVQLKGLDNIVLVGAKAPVSFFAYPNAKSYLVPQSCRVHTLADSSQDIVGGLDGLAQRLGAQDTVPKFQQELVVKLPTGKLNAAKVCQAIGAMLPHNAIISDEANTSGLMLPVNTQGAPRHDVLTLTGGAIGQGLPVAIGAAVACPNRPVIALIGDGSALYTIQSLWTMVREQLDITVVIFNNRSYAILNVELERVGAGQVGPKAKSQLDLSGPNLDFTAFAKGLGMPALHARTGEEFNYALRRSLNEPGPHLIEAMVPSEYTGLKLKALPHMLGALDRIPVPMAKALKKALAP